MTLPRGAADRPVAVRTAVRAVVLAMVLAATLLLSGCTGGQSSDEPATGAAEEPAAGTSEPAPATAAVATVDPASVTNPAEALRAVALRAADLPDGWTVQANPLPDDADLGMNPSLAGICGYPFTSEARRTAKLPVVGVDPAGTVQLSSEAIAYDGAQAATTAVQEVVQAFSTCPDEEYSFQEGPSAEGLAPNSVVFQYALPDGTVQVVVVQARGQVLSVLIGDDPAMTAAAGRSIADRIAELPAGAIGA